MEGIVSNIGQFSLLFAFCLSCYAMVASFLGGKVGHRRLVNTAEMRYRHDQGRYGTFAELVKSSEMEKAAHGFSLVTSVYQKINSQSESEPIAGLQFGLVLAGDGTKYKLSVREKQDKPACGFAFFSDEIGLIFEGRVIACPAQ